jgi:hypothetical protein
MDDATPLLAYGYTRTQAVWLRLVMLHAGVFLRRQYLAFPRTRISGSVDQRLLRRLLNQGHARQLPYHGRERLYHIYARPLYAAIGHEHLRHRRRMAPWLTAVHLLLLDFIIAEPGEYLESEELKVRRFIELGVSRDALPHRVYRSARVPTKTTTRYFVEPYLIAIHERRARFIIPDLSPRSAAPMREFLLRYGALLEKIADVEVVYVTPRAESADTAERLYRRFASGHDQTDLPTIELLDELFRVRASLEERAYGRLTREALDRYEVWAGRLSGHEYDELYQTWRQGGVIALTRARHISAGSSPSTGFRHFRLPWRYYCFRSSPQRSRPVSAGRARRQSLCKTQQN